MSQHWRWDEAFYLPFLIFCPMVVIGILFWQKKLTRQIEMVVGPKVWPYLSSGISFSKKRLKVILLGVALGFLLLALARPQFGEKSENVKSLGVEIMVLFDVSQSMLAEDLSPSRLEFAKKEVIRFIERMPGNKVGLVAFAGSAALVSPITTDASAMKMFIESLSTEVIASQGTEFKLALDQAESAFNRGGVPEDTTSKATKVILVVSDGEDHEPGALEAAEKLAENGIRIFSMAIGTEAGGTIPLRDPNGFLRGYKKNKQGQVIQTKVNGQILKAIAEAGKGSFYTATFAGHYQDELIEDINKLEKTEFDSQVIVNYEERFQIFLLLAIIILFFKLFLQIQKKPSAVWKGRFQAGSR